MRGNGSSFSLRRISLPKIELSESTSRSAADFFDFVVDGNSLRSLLDTADISVVVDGPDPYGWKRKIVRRLLPGMEEAIDERLEGRSQIYGCRECLDIECGGIGVAIERVEGTIRWNNFVQFGKLYDLDLKWILEPLDVGPFEFEYEEYYGALAPFLKSSPD